MPDRAAYRRNLHFFSYSELGIIRRVFEAVGHQNTVLSAVHLSGLEEGLNLLKASRTEFRVAPEHTESRPEGQS